MMRGAVIVTVYPPPDADAVALSEPIAMVGQNSGAGQGLTYGKVTVTESGQTSVTNALFDRMWMRTLRRNGAAAARMSHDYGLAPGLHHLVDPTPAPEPATLIFEDYVSAAIAAGVCDVAVGFLEHINSADASTLVGVGFHCGPDLVWHSFVNDCPTNVAPVTVRRDVALAGKLASDLHRLTVIVDGPSKTISWLIDGITVDSWSPGAPLDQMTAGGPKMMWAAVVPALGDATIRFHGGGLPNVRLLVREL
ncbi:MAG TPA: hypothetical protein VKA60_27640 [Blastocatellia bacterium]|nr:hypothetical protein [Blastocatellia bacterium]